MNSLVIFLVFHSGTAFNPNVARVHGPAGTQSASHAWVSSESASTPLARVSRDAIWLFEQQPAPALQQESQNTRSQFSRQWQPQWQKLIASDSLAGVHRCCLICQGSGRIAGRSRRKRKRQNTSALAPSSNPPLIPCAACDGIGLVPSTPLLPHHPVPCMGKNATVAIIGGGLGGLALALALQQRNISCTVFERDASFAERAQGYGLTMQQGSRAIRALGLSPDIAEAGLTSVAHLCFDAITGALIGSHGAASRGDEGAAGGPAAELDERALRRRNIHLPRQSLRALLFRRLRPGTVRWGCRFLGASVDDSALEGQNVQGASVELRFMQRAGDKLHSREVDAEGAEQEDRIRASVLIGCDGIFSAVRETLTRAAGEATPTPLRSLDVMVILGYAAMGDEEPFFATDDTVVEWVDGVSRLYTMPFEQGVTMWQFSFPCGADAGRALTRSGKSELLAEARRRIERWPAPAVHLLQATQADVVTGYPCYDREVSDIWSTPCKDESQLCAVHAGLSAHSTLIGDAAHPMAPFKGQGANQALIDAIELARALYDSQFGDTAAATNAANVGNLALCSSPPPDADLRLVKRQRRRSRQPLDVALRGYEQAASPRAARKVEASRAATPLLHSPSARAPAEGALTRAAASAAAAARHEQGKD